MVMELGPPSGGSWPWKAGVVVIYQPLWEYFNIFTVTMGVLMDFCSYTLMHN